MKRFISITFSLCFPIFLFAQISDGYKQMKMDTNPEFNTYENLMYKASDYLMKNPIDPKSNEFMASIKIIDFWKDKDTGVNIPTFGKFYSALPEKGPHRYFYMVGMVNYVLSEKLENNRILKCVKIDGQKYSEQEDVKEVQIGGAKIFLNFVSNPKNGMELNKKGRKYLKAHKKEELEEMFFKKTCYNTGYNSLLPPALN